MKYPEITGRKQEITDIFLKNHKFSASFFIPASVLVPVLLLNTIHNRYVIMEIIFIGVAWP